jgi:hypothetical protein
MYAAAMLPPFAEKVNMMAFFNHVDIRGMRGMPPAGCVARLRRCAQDWMFSDAVGTGNSTTHVVLSDGIAPTHNMTDSKLHLPKESPDSSVKKERGSSPPDKKPPPQQLRPSPSLDLDITADDTARAAQARKDRNNERRRARYAQLKAKKKAQLATDPKEPTDVASQDDNNGTTDTGKPDDEEPARKRLKKEVDDDDDVTAIPQVNNTVQSPETPRRADDDTNNLDDDSEVRQTVGGKTPKYSHAGRPTCGGKGPATAIDINMLFDENDDLTASPHDPFSYGHHLDEQHKTTDSSDADDDAVDNAGDSDDMPLARRNHPLVEIYK